MGSSEGSGQLVRGVLVDSESSASRAGSAAPLLPRVVVPGRGLARARLHRGLMNMSGAARVFQAQAQLRHFPPPRCEAQHAGHLLASSYLTLRGIEMMEQTEEEFYLQ